MAPRATKNQSSSLRFSCGTTRVSKSKQRGVSSVQSSYWYPTSRENRRLWKQKQAAVSSWLILLFSRGLSATWRWHRCWYSYHRNKDQTLTIIYLRMLFQISGSKPKKKKRSCTGRESNPGLPRGRREFYHWTTSAADGKCNGCYAAIPCHFQVLLLW